MSSLLKLICQVIFISNTFLSFEVSSIYIIGLSPTIQKYGTLKFVCHGTLLKLRKITNIRGIQIFQNLRPSIILIIIWQFWGKNNNYDLRVT